jgi:squalene-hopene/tetraprenyl-beta-curcumene cyclase
LLPASEMIDYERLRAAYEKVRDELLAERTPDSHWVGQLSSSALATATAVSALVVAGRQESGVRDQEISGLICRGVDWLVKQQNDDGGFGDTDLSHSNIATTMLAVAALHLAGVAVENDELIKRANAYIDAKGRLKGLRERYGIDKTFVVPIMTNLALAGLVDWKDVDPLPFEFACVPQSLYRFVGMPVVSYAIPALVAIGQARFFHAPPRNPIARLIRWSSVSRSLKVLRRMQPDSGGYLEATPLTSFVVMSLASKGSGFGVQGSASEVDGEVIREGVKFLTNSVRPDGAWPIDTNLATWNTTLAINALAGAGEDVAALLGPQCLDWLLSCQHTKRHPFTGADPGGFGWSDLSGAVPDADDTPGAVLAIKAILTATEEVKDVSVFDSSINALRWLLELQNRDGGWPTFCRGWGNLPFDRSGTDLTAHALRAFDAWKSAFVPCDSAPYRTGPAIWESETARPLARARVYIAKHQNHDGSWSPLWFGNQDHPNEQNPVYGTAKVLMAYRDLWLMDSPEAKRGVAWLVGNQNEDGGWGSGAWGKVRNAECGMRSSDESQIRSLKSSIEETSLAVEALLAAVPPTPDPRLPTPAAAAVCRGLAWLIDRVEQGQHRQPAPIGLYFAKLWYYERLYPLIFATAALGRACRQFTRPKEAASTDEPSESRAR